MTHLEFLEQSSRILFALDALERRTQEKLQATRQSLASPPLALTAERTRELAEAKKEGSS